MLAGRNKVGKTVKGGVGDLCGVSLAVAVQVPLSDLSGPGTAVGVFGLEVLGLLGTLCAAAMRDWWALLRAIAIVLREAFLLGCKVFFAMVVDYRDAMRAVSIAVCDSWLVLGKVLIAAMNDYCDVLRGFSNCTYAVRKYPTLLREEQLRGAVTRLLSNNLSESIRLG